MKQLLFYCVFVCSSLVLHSQATFNYRLTFDRPVPTVLTSIVVTDSCFYVGGITNDTIPPFRIGSLFAKMSFEGEILWYKALVDQQKYFGTWRNTLTSTIDGNFIVSGVYSDTLGSVAMLIKYTPQGDTIFLKTYKNPYFPEESFITNNSLFQNGLGNLYLINNIQSPNDHSQSYIVHTTKNGIKIWDQIYGSGEFSESGYSIKPLNNGAILVGGIQTNLNFTSQDYIARTQLIQIDSQGNLEWEYLSPEGELWNNAFDVLPTDDGGYLVASGRGIEVGQLPGTFLQWHSYLFKLDAERNFEWGVDIRDSLPQSTNQLTKLIKVSDESGYITVGTIYEPNPAENGWDLHGIISKISKQGDSLWTRYYNHVVSPSDDHIFYDVEETPDGGFVMVGQATDYHQAVAEPPLQRAWIVKVDEHGCLVPGCHLISSAEDIQRNPFQIKLYPNPARDYLNVYFYHPNLKEAAFFELVDASGKVVLNFTSEHGDITHLVSVEHLAGGVYWLICRVGGDVVREQVVIGG